MCCLGLISWWGNIYLQTIENAAARFIISTGKFERITPVFHDLHWLPVRQTIEFKDSSACLEKCVHGLAPPYLAAFCQASSDQPGRSRHRSADLHQLYVPSIRTNLGDGAFPSMVRLRGTACQLTCGVRFRWTPYNGNSKPTYSRPSVDSAF